MEHKWTVESEKGERKLLVVLVVLGPSDFEGSDHPVHDETSGGDEVDTGHSAQEPSRAMSSRTGDDASHEDQDEEDADQATAELCKLDRLELVRVELESHADCKSLTAVPVVM